MGKPKRKKKKRYNQKANSVKKKRVNRFPITISLITIILIIVPAVAFFNISGKYTHESESLFGVDVVNDCQDSLRGLVTIKPDFESSNIEMGVSIIDWNEKLTNCHKIEVVFPGYILGHNYLKTYDILKGEKQSNGGGNEKIRRTLPEISFNDFGQTIIKVKPEQLKGFDFGSHFVWYKGLRKVSFSEFEIFLPFGTPKEAGSPFRGIADFRVSMVVDRGYELKTQKPEPIGYKFMGEVGIYYYDIGLNKPLLNLVFEDIGLKNLKERLQILFSTLFALGLGLLVEEIISYFRQIKAVQR